MVFRFPKLYTFRSFVITWSWQLGNWSISGITPLQLLTSSSICLFSVILLPNGLIFLSVVTNLPVACILPAFKLRAWFKRKISSINQSTRKWLSERPTGLAIFYGRRREKQVGDMRETSSGARGNSQPQCRVRFKLQSSETRAGDVVSQNTLAAATAEGES